MFAVRLLSFPSRHHERVERVLHKHSATLASAQGPGAQLPHAARKALLHEVASGRPQLIARYAEQEHAEHVARECLLLGAEATVQQEGAA